MERTTNELGRWPDDVACFDDLLRSLAQILTVLRKFLEVHLNSFGMGSHSCAERFHFYGKQVRRPWFVGRYGPPSIQSRSRKATLLSRVGPLRGVRVQPAIAE